MPFRYRLEKVLKYRIQKRDEQFNVVREAQNEVLRIQAEINKNINTVNLLRKSMRSAPYSMMESYDVYIKHLYTIIEELEEEKQKAIERLEEEKEKLKELEKAVNVLEKHKEKAYDQYKEEEKRAEMKRLDEVAIQKYFAKMKEKIEEELSEEERLLLNDNQQ
ncbi:MAG TPA: flagellar export protein FliJ [Candidatus Gastranaerophilales bacterium]|nr:flagellar export protein FliJ [Candidatus Gastranaerophilales bacterium]